MKRATLAIGNIVMTAAIGAMIFGPSMVVAQTKPPETAAPADAPQATEDIIYMSDGRVLHGQIISETRTQVVFQLIDTVSNSSAKMTIAMEDVATIERDVPLSGAEAEHAAAATTDKPAATTEATEPKQEARTYGALRASADAKDIPSFYILPIKGQMGTDVNVAIYEKVKKDIVANKPDVLILQVECRDTEDALYSTVGKEEEGLADMDEYRKIVNLFHDDPDLRPIRQVVWITDSVGVASILAMSWKDIYMQPAARLGGMVAAKDQTGFDGWADEDVRGKMTAAFMAWIKGFLLSGGYSYELADAMVQPKFSLSATWHGREVKWSLNTDGEYVVDSKDKKTAEFRAKTAEDFCISKGTAETIEDLALLLGYREFRVLDSNGQKMVEGYIEDWRRSFDNVQTWMKDYQQYLGWASGDETLQWLGKAKGRLEQVLSAMEQYKAVEIRCGRDLGLRKLNVIVMIEQLKEKIRALKDRPSGGAGGGGAGGGGGRIGSGGGGGRGR